MARPRRARETPPAPALAAEVLDALIATPETLRAAIMRAGHEPRLA